MSEDSHELSAQEAFYALQALGQSAVNGVVTLTQALHLNGDLTKEQAARVHEMMSKPLIHPDNASNPTVQAAQQNLDALFATMLRNS